jgi:hypothetical protein
MKQFVRVECVLTEEELHRIEKIRDKKMPPYHKSILQKNGTTFCCGCGSVSTHQAIFDIGGGTTVDSHYKVK